MDGSTEQVIWFEHLRRGDVANVGGKNASLGELIRNLAPKGIAVPVGFATAAGTYWRYVDFNNIRDEIATHIATGSRARRP